MFKIFYDCERLFWLTTIPLFSRGLVQICSAVPGTILSCSGLSFWVMTDFLMAEIWADSTNENNFFLNLQPKILLLLGCEFNDNMATKYFKNFSLRFFEMFFGNSCRSFCYTTQLSITISNVFVAYIPWFWK